MENIKKVYLENATHNQLIEEFNRRESVTLIQINEGEGATIKTNFGNMNIEGKLNIFVIKENTTTEDSDELKICSDCGVQDKSKDAKFCFHCGTKFE